jgi:hypothetical protein
MSPLYQDEISARDLLAHLYSEGLLLGHPPLKFGASPVETRSALVAALNTLRRRGPRNPFERHNHGLAVARLAVAINDLGLGRINVEPEGPGPW